MKPETKRRLKKWLNRFAVTYYILMVLFSIYLFAIFFIYLPRDKYPLMLALFGAILILIAVCGLMLFGNKLVPKKIKESLPLMRLRMDTFLVLIIFSWSTGIPLVLSASKDLFDNLLEFFFGGALFILGLIFFFKEYIIRYNTLEKQLVSSNKINRK